MSLLSLSFLIQCSIHFVNDDPNYRKPMMIRGGHYPPWLTRRCSSPSLCNQDKVWVDKPEYYRIRYHATTLYWRLTPKLQAQYVINCIQTWPAWEQQVFAPTVSEQQQDAGPNMWQWETTYLSAVMENLLVKQCKITCVVPKLMFL